MKSLIVILASFLLSFPNAAPVKLPIQRGKAFGFIKQSRDRRQFRNNRLPQQSV